MFTIAEYLHRKASVQRVPLNGTFELSPVCNFACKMCYVRRTPEQIASSGKRLYEYREWLELAKECKKAGCLYLLLTGGEPFIYPHFKELYMELHRMGFVLSINTNGTLIDEHTVEWLKTAAPSRINITLYGAGRESYERVCGNAEGFDRVMKAIHLLEAAGITVVINCSMIPENEQDLEKIMEFAREHNFRLVTNSYIFPPARREREATDSRFTPEQSAKMYLRTTKFFSEDAQWMDFLKGELNKVSSKEKESMDANWGAHQEEPMKCRAGRCAFWVSWDGAMTACGMVPFPKVLYPFERPFIECWQELTQAVRTTPVLKGCAGCPKEELCRPCVARIQAETGDVNARAPYLCEMTDCIIENMKSLLEGQKE